MVNSACARQPVGRFVAIQALIWMLAAPLLGMVVARIAVWAQTFRAPLLVFPLLVGCGLGLALAALMRFGHVGHRGTIWSGTVLAVAVAVAGQHYFSFLDFKAALTAKKPQGLSLEAFQAFQERIPAAPTDFARFMAEGRAVTADYSLHGAAAWASWILDGLLVLVATSTIIYLACRVPYCSVCRSWYRTTRAGPVAADRARRMAEVGLLPIEEPFDTAQYRLSHCIGGCGPSRLQLACRGRAKSTAVEAWLSVAEREQIVRVLDGESCLDGMN